jgi:hypothetical protein
MSKKQKVKMTLLLDSDTINILKAYAVEQTGNESVSMGVRMLAKEHDKNETRTDK